MSRRTYQTGDLVEPRAGLNAMEDNFFFVRTENQSKIFGSQAGNIENITEKSEIYCFQ